MDAYRSTFPHARADSALSVGKTAGAIATLQGMLADRERELRDARAEAAEHAGTAGRLRRELEALEGLRADRDELLAFLRNRALPGLAEARTFSGHELTSAARNLIDRMEARQ
jgi:hypothetical protein